MKTDHRLHRLARRGHVPDVEAFLAVNSRLDLDAFDAAGRTALMEAVRSPKASAGLVRLLAGRGADVNLESRYAYEPKMNCAALALRAGDPEKLTAVLEFGARVDYRRPDDYDALMDACFPRNGERLLELLRILLAHGVRLSGTSGYGESALRVLSRLARFDAVRMLLEAGADEAHLRWTPLIRAVALDSLARVESLIRRGASLEETDYWGRTAFLVAVACGDVAKARLLMERDANVFARGRCDKPACHYAAETGGPDMLRWLIEAGIPVDEVDEFGTTALMTAAEHGNAATATVLVKCGVDLEAQTNGETALGRAESGGILALLLDAGADPSRLSREGRRVLTGLEAEASEDELAGVTQEEFDRGWQRRFGQGNPEEMHEPFWHAMVRAGVTAYHGGEYFGGGGGRRAPVWCADRFGQSLTRLLDGRIVQIAGEHEDSYDRDFCIYNDVFVHHPDGRLQIFAYPEAVFPPTDFHSVTQVGDFVYIIGSLGYFGARRYGTTPVYRLDTRTFAIEQVTVAGEAPGWIYGHKAVRRGEDEIVLSGGTIAMAPLSENGHEIHAGNERVFVFNLRNLQWHTSR